MNKDDTHDLSVYVDSPLANVLLRHLQKYYPQNENKLDFIEKSTEQRESVE